MDTFIHQALTAFEQRDLDVTGLVMAALEEIDQHPERRQAVVGELTSAFQAGGLSANDLATVMKALAEKRGAAVRVQDVRMPGQQEDPEATMYAGEQQTVASSGGAGPAATQRPPPVMLTEPLTQLAEPTVAPTPGVLGSGHVLNNRFELEEAIGEGGMGKVFRAKDRVKVEARDRDPYVALKVLGESFSQHPDSLVALQREARNSQRLSHPNIVRVNDFDCDRESNHYYITMEYLRGEPLDEIAQRRTGEPAPFAEVWPIISGTGAALVHAHTHKIVHSDIKPSNIWITERGEVKVLDFGIARAMDPDTKTNWQGVAAVTPRYASPEMLRREEPDPRDDLYGLACVSYELLTGKHPFDKTDALGAQAKSLTPERPAGLKLHQWRALENALSFDRDARTPSVRQFLQDFAPDRQKKFPLMAIGLAAVVASIVVAGIVMWLRPGGVNLTPEERYLARLLETRTTALVSDEEAESLQEMGLYFLDSGKDDFNQGEYQRGNAELKNGASTAFLPFYNILQGTKDETRRRAAAMAILRIDKAYISTVEDLKEQSMPQKALWLTCQALAAPPYTDSNLPRHVVLSSLYKKLWADVKGSKPPAAETGCTADQIDEAWGAALHTRGALRGR